MPAAMNRAPDHPQFAIASFKQEENLVIALIRKDRRAIEYLYDNYCDALYGIIFRILDNEALAEDALQETFVKVWKKIEGYNRNKGRLYTWMLRIARNTAIDIKRANFKRLKQEPLDRFSAKDNPAIWDSMHTKDTGIRSLVEKMKPEQKEIIDLLYFGGYTQVEAAKYLNLPLGTVKTRTRSALQFLRKALKHEEL